MLNALYFAIGCVLLAIGMVIATLVMTIREIRRLRRALRSGDTSTPERT